MQLLHSICMQIFIIVWVRERTIQQATDCYIRISFTYIIYRKYSVLPHITDKHMRFSPPPANTSGGYTLI